MINFSTGPVTVLPSVSRVFAEPPISHRSPEFKAMFNSLTATISERLSVKETFIVTGSGTVANEIMVGQIALRGDRGLILSNGEFGERLVGQARRHRLEFDVLRAGWGDRFSTDEIETLLQTGEFKWILFCHCESSTGVINPLKKIEDLCKQYSCGLYVDCMSTFANMPLDLSGVNMATASSGKAIGSFAGLALVFSNQEIPEGHTLPVCLDLHHVKRTGGVPFTISSNLLVALHEAVKHNLAPGRWRQLAGYSQQIYELLNSMELVPFATPDSRVFTIAPTDTDVSVMAMQLDRLGLHLSYQSEYLLKRNWLQLAIFGTYTQAEIDHALKCLRAVCAGRKSLVV